MKQLILGLTLITAVGTAQAAPTVANELSRSLQNLQLLQNKLALQNANKDAISWKVGDFHDLKIEFLIPGSGRKEVKSEEVQPDGQVAIWYQQDISLLGQNTVAQMLIRRSDGVTLRSIVNGEEQDVSAGNEGTVEIVEQAETTVTVPAGTFDCIYVKANITQDGQTQQIELWVNPIDVNLDGALKVTMQSQMGPLSLVLKSFGPK